ncbi:transposase [Streptomyces sp. NPDC058665]|uniref:IS110 family transposase n=1 Tax=Streptomyces sp. NPDC058665 TaxID=3346586 RepID=UPI0036677401
MRRKPVFYLLEHDIECWLLNARHMKAVPGRKTDVKDVEWIAELVEHGLVRPSFVPPEPIRKPRDLIRGERDPRVLAEMAHGSMGGENGPEPGGCGPMRCWAGFSWWPVRFRVVKSLRPGSPRGTSAAYLR